MDSRSDKSGIYILLPRRNKFFLCIINNVFFRHQHILLPVRACTANGRAKGFQEQGLIKLHWPVPMSVEACVQYLFNY